MITYCEYSALHRRALVLATETVPALVDGREVPACAQCADFAHRLHDSGSRRREEFRLVAD